MTFPEKSTEEDICSLGIGRDFLEGHRIITEKKDELKCIKMETSVLQKAPLRK